MRSRTLLLLLITVLHDAVLVADLFLVTSRYYTLCFCHDCSARTAGDWHFISSQKVLLKHSTKIYVDRISWVTAIFSKNYQEGKTLTAIFRSGGSLALTLSRHVTSRHVRSVASDF